MKKDKPTLGQLFREVELAMNNDREVYESCVNGQFKQARNQLQEQLDQRFDMSGVEITVDDIVGFYHNFVNVDGDLPNDILN